MNVWDQIRQHLQNKINTFVLWTTESTTIVGKLEKHARSFSLYLLQPWKQGGTLDEFDWWIAQTLDPLLRQYVWQKSNWVAMQAH